MQGGRVIIKSLRRFFMSKLFSKVLAICALVVTIPLLVIGTALTAYYSINATIAVEIFAESSLSSSAYAKVNGKAEGFEITKSHLEKETLTETTVGYEFAGWFNGTYKEFLDAYAQAGDDIDAVEYISKDSSVELKMAEVENVVAAFKTVKFAVSYSYQEHPGDGEYITDVPTGGKTEYKFGEALPVLTTTSAAYQSRIAGWQLVVDEQATEDVYTTAEFDGEGPYVLRAKWVPKAEYTVTYSFGDLVTDPTIVDGEKYEGTSFDLRDTSVYNDRVEGGLAAGEKLVWCLEGTDTVCSHIDNIDHSVSVVLTKVNVTYSVALTEVSATDMRYTKTHNATFTKDSKDDLAQMLLEANYETKYSFWKFEGVEFGGVRYTNVNDLAAAIIATSEHAEPATAVGITAGAKKYFSSVEVISATCKGQDPEDEEGIIFNKPVYYSLDGEEFSSANNLGLDEADPSKTINAWFYKGTTRFYAEAHAGAHELLLKSVGLGTGKQLNVGNDTTINDLLDFLYGHGWIELGEVATLNGLTANFIY